MFETAVIDTAPKRRRWARSLEQRFTEVEMPDPIRQTLLRYIGVRAAVLRPKSVESLINDLLPFAEYLTAHHPDVISLRELDRSCIEGYLKWNRTRGWRGQRAAAGAGAPSRPRWPSRQCSVCATCSTTSPPGAGRRPHHGGWYSPPTSPNSTSRCHAR
ncbi:hypothetical protein [Mycobacterium sp. MAC_080597_8934]|uniref:hypothetical protein n=1 Tax=Mycobacterium sp. MAC_080597_8934 TaxID=1335322 RepID=UPI0021017DEE|nr:hypothetical protein [Mycobacterium sp. MAC_080597_8934]